MNQQTPSHRHLNLILSHHHHSSPIITQYPISSSPIVTRTTPSSLPVTPHHPYPYSYPYSNTKLLDRVLSSPSYSKSSSSSSLPSRPDNNSLYRTLVQTGIHLTPKKLSKAINHLISEKKSTYLNPDMHASFHHSFRRSTEHLEQTPRKKLKIQSAPDGSASLVVSSDLNLISSSSLTPPTTITSSSPSLSSKACSNRDSRAHCFPVYHQSALVSADIQNYGRVAIKKEALIDRLGFEAAQRAIHKARGSRQRQPFYPPRPAQLPPSPQTASSRSNRIKKWLDSADHDDEDEEDYSIVPSGPPLSIRARDLLDTFTRLTESGRKPAQKVAGPPASDAQSLFWSPVPSSTLSSVPHKSNDSSSHSHHDVSREGPTGFHSSGPDPDSSRTSTLVDRPSTPPLRQSPYCHTDNKPNVFGSFSHLSFSQSSPTSTNTMLKPGCNLNQSFLSLAPSPTIILKGSDELPGGMITNDENKSLALKNAVGNRYHRTGFTPGRNQSQQSSNAFRSSKNDFSPCSPVRQEVMKLIDQTCRLESPNDNRLIDNTFDSYPSSIQSFEHSWLTELDPNRDRENFNLQPQPSRYQISNHNRLNSSSSINLFDDHNIFEDFSAFS